MWYEQLIPDYPNNHYWSIICNTFSKDAWETWGGKGPTETSYVQYRAHNFVTPLYTATIIETCFHVLVC